MRFKAVLWDAWNIGHIGRHGVSQNDVEELIDHPQLIRRTRGGCYALYGQSVAGRYLAVIVAPRTAGMAYVVTARDMSDNEKHWMRRQK